MRNRQRPDPSTAKPMNPATQAYDLLAAYLRKAGFNNGMAKMQAGRVLREFSASGQAKARIRVGPVTVTITRR